MSSISVKVVGALVLVNAVVSAPMYNGEPFGAPDSNGLYFDHQISQELDNLNYKQSLWPDMTYPPPVHGGNSEHYGQFMDNQPHVAYPHFNDHVAYPHFNDHDSSHHYPANEGTSSHYGVNELANQFQQHSYHPNDYNNFYPSGTNDETEASYTPAPEEHAPAYGATSTPGSPSGSLQNSETHNQDDSNTLNGRHKFTDSEIMSRPKKLRTHKWQSFYSKNEMIEIYETLFIWDQLCRRTAEDFLKKVNNGIQARPDVIPLIQNGIGSIVSRFAKAAGPNSSKNTCRSFLSVRDTMDKTMFIQWVLGERKKGRPSKTSGSK